MNSKFKSSVAPETVRRLKTSSLNSLFDLQNISTSRFARTQNRSSRTLQNSPTSRQRVANAFRLIYRGNATTTLAQIDPSTGRIIGSVRSSQTATTAEITDPRVAGGIRETNPFSLSISSSPAEVRGLKEGAFTMNSALPFDFQGGFLVQYWNLRYDGTQLSGQLTNTGSQFALATNLINASGTIAPDQINMNRGTTITGRITTNQIQVRIQGTGVTLLSGQYAFVIDAVLSR